MEVRRHQLEIFADYHQFYIEDAARNTDTGRIWTEEALDRMVAAGPDLVAVSTARAMIVPVMLEIADAAPEDDAAEWEHVVDCGLAVPSGEIIVAGCTDYLPDCPHFTVPAGDYAVRVSFANLSDLSEDGLEGNDRYRVQLWPGRVDGVVVRTHR